MKSELERLSRSLMKVHKLVLEHARLEAEQALGHQIAPLEFFNLLTQDERFAWLKPISSVLAEIDETIDESVKNGTAITSKELDHFRERVEFILINPISPVAAKYLGFLASDADLVMAHADLRTQFDSKKSGPLH